MQKAIIDSLIKKTILAAKINNIEQIIVAGGVAANKKLIEELRANFSGMVLVPPPILCTDNAAMVAAAAFYNANTQETLEIQANPNLSLAY